MKNEWFPFFLPFSQVFLHCLEFDVSTIHCIFSPAAKTELKMEVLWSNSQYREEPNFGMKFVHKLVRSDLYLNIGVQVDKISIDQYSIPQSNVTQIGSFTQQRKFYNGVWLFCHHHN